MHSRVVMTINDIYETHIIHHFELPNFRNRPSRPYVAQELTNPTCGDSVQLFLRLSLGRIETARFCASGCIISQASASILCEWLEGRFISSAAELDAQSMLRLMQVPLTTHRQQCALLPHRALKMLLEGEQGRGSGEGVQSL